MVYIRIEKLTRSPLPSSPSYSPSLTSTPSHNPPSSSRPPSPPLSPCFPGTFDAPDVGFRWLADDEVVHDPEGLGEDFEDTPWVKPDYKKALQARYHNIFMKGTAPLLATTIDELGQMGEGIHLYFTFLKIMCFASFVGTLVYLPVIVLAYEGTAIPRIDMDLLKMAQFSIGNIGPPITQCQAVYTRSAACAAVLNHSKVLSKSLNITYTAEQVGQLVQATDLIVTFIFIGVGLYLQYLVRQISHHAKQDFSTSRDYAVKVSDIPDTTESLELCDHFSRHFAVDMLPQRVGSHVIDNGSKVCVITYFIFQSIIQSMFSC